MTLLTKESCATAPDYTFATLPPEKHWLQGSCASTEQLAVHDVPVTIRVSGELMDVDYVPNTKNDPTLRMHIDPLHEDDLLGLNSILMMSPSSQTAAAPAYKVVVERDCTPTDPSFPAFTDARSNPEKRANSRIEISTFRRGNLITVDCHCVREEGTNTVRLIASSVMLVATVAD